MADAGASADRPSQDLVPSGDSRSDGAVGRRDAVEGDDDALSGCLEPRDVIPAGAVCVHSVRGTVTALDGLALAGRLITLCGPACFFGETSAGGAFSVEPEDLLNLARYSVTAHGRPDFATLNVPTEPAVDGTSALREAMRLPRYTDRGPPIPDGVRGGTVTAGDVTVTIAPGTRIDPDIEDAELGELGTLLRTVRVPLESAPRLAREAGLADVYALGPFNLTTNTPMALRLRNRAMLPAGTRVEFLGLSYRIVDPPFDAGHWVVMARGVVSPDGAEVRTNDTEGLTVLTWVGYRALRSP
ncbi:MAG: hypothetical protein HY909_09905 [Deltaproteobacteria bacterium]|nr:hypothetical protein [Deltaproteobacteria bacterium]